MESKAAGESSYHHTKQQLALARDTSTSETKKKTLVHKAVGHTCRGTATMTKHLPAGAVLVFQLLSPILTKQGESLGQGLTAGLIALCALLCFLLSFTDSFRDKKGNVCHGIATFNGLWVIDGTETISPELAAKYRLRPLDFMHAFMSAVVFATLALSDQHVISCFFLTYLVKIQKIVSAMPVGVSAIYSIFFLVFPSQRHGIGFPLSAD